jgi:signal peptidase II
MSSLLRERRAELLIVIAVVGVDQLAKAMVRAHLPLYETIAVVPNLVNFTFVRNTGAAFGLLDAMDFPLKTPLLAVFAAAALIAVGSYAAGMAHHQRIARTGLALIIGGAAGNLIDRVIAGSVVDFVDVYWRTYHFWTFNVADSAITVGVAMMILDMLGNGEHVSEAV